MIGQKVDRCGQNRTNADTKMFFCKYSNFFYYLYKSSFFEKSIKHQIGLYIIGYKKIKI